MDDNSGRTDRQDSPVAHPHDRTVATAEHSEPMIPEDAGFGWLMTVGLIRCLRSILRGMGTALRWMLAVLAWGLSPLTAPFRTGRYAVVNSEKPSATTKDVTKPSAAAVSHWLGRQYRIASIRGRHLALWMGQRLHRDTAWLCASITGTAGLILMAIVQLMYVLPTTASLQSQEETASVGPHEARDLLPLVTSTGTSASPVPFPTDLPDFAPTGNFDKYRREPRIREISQADRPLFDPSKPPDQQGFVRTRPRTGSTLNVEPAGNESSPSSPPPIKPIPTEGLPSPLPTGPADPLDNLFPNANAPVNPEPSSTAFDPVLPTPVRQSEPLDNQPIAVDIAPGPVPGPSPTPAADPLDALFGPAPQPPPDFDAPPTPEPKRSTPTPMPTRTPTPSPAMSDPLDALFAPTPTPAPSASPTTKPEPTPATPVQVAPKTKPEPMAEPAADPLDVLFAPSPAAPKVTPVSNPTPPKRIEPSPMERESSSVDPLDSLFGPMPEPSTPSPEPTPTPSFPQPSQPEETPIPPAAEPREPQFNPQPANPNLTSPPLPPDFSNPPSANDDRAKPTPAAADPLDALFAPVPERSPAVTPTTPASNPQPNNADNMPSRGSVDPLDSLFEPPPSVPESTPAPEPPDFGNTPRTDTPRTDVPRTDAPRMEPTPAAADPLDSLFEPPPRENVREERPLFPEPDANSSKQPTEVEPTPAMTDSPIPYSVEPRPSIDPPIERLPAERNPSPTRVPSGDPLDSLFPSVPNATPPPPRPVTEPKRATIEPTEQFDVFVLALPPSDPATFELSSRIHLPDRRPRPTMIARDRWERTTGATMEIAAPVRSYRERLSEETRRQLEADLSDGPESDNVPVLTAGNRKDHLREHELDVSVEKRSPSEVAANLPTRYEIWVHNHGAKPVPSVDVDDNVPPTHRVIAVDPPALFDHDTLRWRLRNLRPNELRKLTVELVPTQTGTIETFASVKATITVSSSTNVKAQSDSNLKPDPISPLPIPSNRPTTPDISPQPRPPLVRLRLDVDAPDRLRVGQPCGIVFTVTNTGTEQVEGIWLRTSLPETLTHRIGQRLEYIVGRLAAGESKEIHLAPQARTIGRLPIDTVILVDGEEADVARREPVVYDPGLRLRRKGWREITVGRAVTFTNHVENQTNRELDRIRVEEFVPSGMEVVDVGQGGVYDPISARIVWNINQIPPHQTQTLDVTLRPREIGPHRSEVSATVGDDSVVPIAARVEAKPVDELATNRTDR